MVSKEVEWDRLSSCECAPFPLLKMELPGEGRVLIVRFTLSFLCYYGTACCSLEAEGRGDTE